MSTVQVACSVTSDSANWIAFWMKLPRPWISSGRRGMVGWSSRDTSTSSISAGARSSSSSWIGSAMNGDGDAVLLMGDARRLRAALKRAGDGRGHRCLVDRRCAAPARPECPGSVWFPAPARRRLRLALTPGAGRAAVPWRRRQWWRAASPARVPRRPPALPRPTSAVLAPGPVARLSGLRTCPARAVPARTRRALRIQDRQHQRGPQRTDEGNGEDHRHAGPGQGQGIQRQHGHDGPMARKARIDVVVRVRIDADTVTGARMMMAKGLETPPVNHSSRPNCTRSQAR